MTFNIDEQKAYANLAQIYNACYYSRSNEKNVEKILEKTLDINYTAPATNYLQLEKSNLIGNTALHFAFQTEKIKIFDLLLSHSADYTIQNSKASTVLHEVIRFNYRHYEDPQKLERRLECSFVDSILSAHVRDKNFTNPRNENGLSHFHGACMANNVDAVELFLNNGVSVDQTVNMGSSYFAGWTPIHFAVRCGSLETCRMLLHRGANVNLKNAKGMTPLHVAVEQSIKMIDWINTGKDVFRKHLPNDAKVNEEIFNAFIKYNRTSGDVNTVDSTGLSYFHIACTMQDTTVAESLFKCVTDINHAVGTDSPICPGYTAAHFAALFNVKTLKLLSQNGANVELQDANGVTPFELCLHRYDASDIHFIMSSHSTWKNILLSDNKTMLLDVISSMRDPDEFADFLESTGLDVNTFVPGNSPVWPQYTLLHLAVTLSEKFKQKSNYSEYPCLRVRLFKPCLEIIKKCLERGSDVLAQDCRGRTPLHLAFRQFKVNTVDLLLPYYTELTNAVDQDGLSHLHVACAAKDETLVKQLLSNGADVHSRLKRFLRWYDGKQFRPYAGESPNITINANSTLLHIAVRVESRELVEILLKYGADLYAQDDSGKTPIHLLIGLKRPKRMADVLLSTSYITEVTTNSRLSYLHVASVLNDGGAVELFLAQGVDVDIVHNDLQTHYAGYTPLAIAIENNCSNIICSLMQRGANIFAKNPDQSSLVCKLFCSSNRRYLNGFVNKLRCDDVARKYMQDNLGLTMLHIACHMRDIDYLKDLLSNGADVNAKAHENSELWPGSTPLHVLVMPSYVPLRNDKFNLDNVKAMMQLLLDNGANVTLTDAQRNTPIHLAAKNSYYDNSLDHAVLLLKHHKMFNGNPKSVENISHFHVACFVNDTASVEEFLKFDAPLNEPVDYLSFNYPGYSPLHLALYHRTADASSRLRTVDYLLQKGASVNAEDALGNTPFHIAANCDSGRLDLLKKLYSAGADIKAIDIFGKTPFETLLSSENNCSVEEMEFFLKNGCYLNGFNAINQVGYIGLIFSMENKSILQEHIFEAMANGLDYAKPDDRDRTIIHNVISTSMFSPDCLDSRYVEVIKKLTMITGYDVDDQDKQGKTALHLAASFRNLPAVCGLLKIGADANVTDANGQTAFADAWDALNRCDREREKYEYEEVIETFITYLSFLEVCGIPINERNIATKTMALKSYSPNTEKINCFLEQMEKTKIVQIGQMALGSFLSGTQAANDYIDISESDRCAVDTFFQKLDENYFDEVTCVLNLQYRKALNRLKSVSDRQH